MVVVKGELYFKSHLESLAALDGKLGGLVIEWIESAIQDNSLFSLCAAFSPYSSLVLDAMWVVDEATVRPSLAILLRHFIMMDAAVLTKLAIERLEAELLEAAGVITSAQALLKKTSRINTLINYKFNKISYQEEVPAGFEKIKDWLKLAREELLGQEGIWEFYEIIGCWELDLHRVLELALPFMSANLVSNLETAKISREKIVSVVQIKFELLWKMADRDKVGLEVDSMLREHCLCSLKLCELGVLTLEELEAFTLPSTKEEADEILNLWKESLKKGKVSSMAPSYDIGYELAMLNASYIPNQRAYLYWALMKSNPNSSNTSTCYNEFAAKLLHEEPCIQYLLPKEDDFSAILRDEELLIHISLNGPDPSLHDELWKRISALRYEERFELYQRWIELANSHPGVAYSRQVSINSVKRFLRRLSKDNVRQYCRLLGKISHPNPLPVFKILLEQIMAYDNLTVPVIESLRYLSVLEFDILSFCLIKTFIEAFQTRSALKTDAATCSLWLQNLATFAGTLFKRYGNGLGELGAWLHLLYDQLEKERNCFALIFLQELLEQMGGCSSPENTPDEAALIQAAGGPLLKKCFGEKEEEKNRYSKRLFQALKSHNLLLPMYLAIDSIREWLLDAADGHAKVLSDFADHASYTMLQYSEFLGQFREYINLEELEKIDSTSGYLYHLKRMLQADQRGAPLIWQIGYEQLDLGFIYKREMGKLSPELASKQSTMMKLKRKMLEEEMITLSKAPKATQNNDLGEHFGDNRISVEDERWLVMRGLVSSPDAWLMGQLYPRESIDGELKKAGNISPILTCWEAHNYGRFLRRLLQRYNPNEHSKDRDQPPQFTAKTLPDGSDSSSNQKVETIEDVEEAKKNGPYSTDATMVNNEGDVSSESSGPLSAQDSDCSQEIAVSTMEVSMSDSANELTCLTASTSLAEKSVEVSEEKQESIGEVGSVIIQERGEKMAGDKRGLEEGEVHVEDNSYQILASSLSNLITNGLEGDEESEYVERRNFLIIIWRVSEGCSLFLEDKLAREMIEKTVKYLKSNEKREDLKVLATRIDATIEATKRKCEIKSNSNEIENKSIMGTREPKGESIKRRLSESQGGGMKKARVEDGIKEPDNRREKPTIKESIKESPRRDPMRESRNSRYESPRDLNRETRDQRDSPRSSNRESRDQGDNYSSKKTDGRYWKTHYH